MVTRPHLGRLRPLRCDCRRHLPRGRAGLPPGRRRPVAAPLAASCRPPPRLRRPQRRPPRPLRRHGRRLRPLGPHPHALAALALLLPPGPHQRRRLLRPRLLLGPRLLPLQALRAGRHPPHPPLRRGRAPPPHLPPRVPPRRGGGHVLRVAGRVAVAGADRAGHQRGRPRRHVRLLPVLQPRAALAAAVEARGDGDPDRAVRPQLRGLAGLPLVTLPLCRRLPGDERMALQRSLQRLPARPLPQLPHPRLPGLRRPPEREDAEEDDEEPRLVPSIIHSFRIRIRLQVANTNVLLFSGISSSDELSWLGVTGYNSEAIYVEDLR